MRETSEEPLFRGAWNRAIALDGGTTNTRARRVEDGKIVAIARRQVGVRDNVLGDRSASRPLAAAVRELIGEVAAACRPAGGDSCLPYPELIVAAGMLSSELGLLAVPHVQAPAGIEELAAAVEVRTLPEVAALPIHFVPGVRTPRGEGPDGWTLGDVMRGEECETMGAMTRLADLGSLELGREGVTFVWPGSHTKVVEVDALGRIVRSQTSLAGELIDAVARHTLLAASLPASLPETLDPTAVDAGARVVAQEGLARAAFLVRIAGLLGRLNSEERAAFWIGAVVGDDARHMVQHLVFHHSRPVWVGGRNPLRALYSTFLARLHAGPVQALDDELAEAASALGALAIARAFNQTGRPNSSP
jgi:2-dehydro-3-deoxygalactonokinase